MEIPSDARLTCVIHIERANPNPNPEEGAGAASSAGEGKRELDALEPGGGIDGAGGFERQRGEKDEENNGSIDGIGGDRSREASDLG